MLSERQSTIICATVAIVAWLALVWILSSIFPAKSAELGIASTYTDRLFPDGSRWHDGLFIAHRTIPPGHCALVKHYKWSKIFPVGDIGPCTTKECLGDTPRIAKRIADLPPAAAKLLHIQPPALSRVFVMEVPCAMKDAMPY